MELLKKTLANISKLDQEKMEQAQERLDSLTKPPGSLGKLEDMAIKLAGISGDTFYKVDRKAHIVMAADHGVVAEGVSAFPQEVTTQMVYNFLNGGAAVNVLAEQMDVEVNVVDIGVVSKIEKAEGLLVRKVKPGTDNFVKGPAMSREEAIKSIEVGIEVVDVLVSRGVKLIGTGEMGIGNTTSSSAILAAITAFPLDEIVGYGTGINEEMLAHKKSMIKKAITVNNPDKNDGLDILAKIGGLEIGGMAGVMLGAAARNVPVMIDGLISGSAALIAERLKSNIVDYLIPSHISAEPGHIKIYQYLGLEPMLNMNMRLGEGTGAILGMNLVEAATKIISGMATFEEAAVSGSM